MEEFVLFGVFYFSSCNKWDKPKGVANHYSDERKGLTVIFSS